MSGLVVRFVSLTKEQYLNLADDKKTDDTLFFCSGTNEIYKGKQLYGKTSNEKLHIGDKIYDGTEEITIDTYNNEYVIAEVEEDYTIVIATTE